MQLALPDWLLARHALLVRETQARAGSVPGGLGDFRVGPGEQRLIGGEYLMRTHSGLAFHYVRGKGVTVGHDSGVDAVEAELWLKGSVYCAVAAINGFVPIHASAVACNGLVHAFTGPSGAGKSTLIAALGGEGLAMFCDDTLVLDLGDPGQIWCLPGHKRLKLRADALAASGAASEGPVGAQTGKIYAAPPAGSVAKPMPLGRFYALARADAVDIAELDGAERLAQLNDGHYTGDLLALGRNFDRVQAFTFLAGLAARLPMARVGLPFDLSRLAGSASEIAAAIRNIQPPGPCAPSDSLQ